MKVNGTSRPEIRHLRTELGERHTEVDGRVEDILVVRIPDYAACYEPLLVADRSDAAVPAP
jgi:hypothetical protein